MTSNFYLIPIIIFNKWFLENGCFFEVRANIWIYTSLFFFLFLDINQRSYRRYITRAKGPELQSTKSKTVIETGGCIFLSSYLLSPSGPYIEVVKSDIYELKVFINVGFESSICFSMILVYINILVLHWLF